MFKHIPHSIIGMYVWACSFKKRLQEKTLDHYDPFGLYSPPPVGTSNAARRTVVVRVAWPQTCTMSPTRVPTLSEMESQSNNKGTNFVSPHEIDECHVDLNIYKF
jgi:hypothetical protein